MGKLYTGLSVLEAAVARMENIYREGHRAVVSFSGGKDSTVAMEVCIIAARNTGRLPVDVVMRDEEIMFPGTFEYAERVWRRPEVNMLWISPRQPIINIFNRHMPYYWVFDPLLEPEQWVRQPPPWITWTTTNNIEAMNTPVHFPPAEGKALFSVTGIRGQESRTRLMSIYSTGNGFMTKPTKFGVRNLRPLYDWTDGDVWKFIRDNRLDYNTCYDTLHRMGVPRSVLRIAPPLMMPSSIPNLQKAARAWPAWFDRVCDRCPGVRTGVQFGRRAIQPRRRYGETWKETFYRECVDEAPAWIRERALKAMERQLRYHAHHSTQPLPDVAPCEPCFKGNYKQASWKLMARDTYGGDPFSYRLDLPHIPPEQFREGAGVWEGKPTW